MKTEISKEDLECFDVSFDSSPANVIAMNAVVKNGICGSAMNSNAKAANQHAFSITVESGDVCNQKKSGRCWMFASLNVMRLEVMKKLNIKNMELSQAYPLFYDKLERANYFLENIIDTLDLPLHDRVVDFLLSAPMGDGGQWDMFRSIVAKYGVVPQDLMPESESSSNTHDMDEYLTKKLRECAMTLRTSDAEGNDISALRELKDDMMDTVYRILCISLGKPPVKFTWETYDKDNKFIRIPDITPQDFCAQYVGLDLDSLVTVINAPTKDKPYGRTFTVKYLGNVRGGKYPVKYLNLPMDELKKLTVAQLKDGQTVWFGSDCGQFSDKKGGYYTLDAMNVQTLLGTDFPMTKEERLDYGESLMTHAMVITGVDLDDNGKPIRWKVENSWGKEVGKDGYYVMSDDWFSEYAYQILLDRKYLTAEQSAQFDTEPVELQPWDPMGSLAL